MKILGIDPGQATGLAIYIGGQLKELRTIGPTTLKDAIKDIAPQRVVYEDSRLQSATFGRGVSPAALRKIARNVGMVDGICSQIDVICGELGIPAHGISPKGKGKKRNADEFRALTGWRDTSNQHERDAAMVAFGYRRVSK